MPQFSEQSLTRLYTCRPALVDLFQEVVVGWDCTVLAGHRPEGAQEEAFRTGNSDLHWPDSRHNSVPSEAADVMPFPIDWEDWERNRAFGGFVLGVAFVRKVAVRWGGDWDGDRTFTDQRLVDLPHWELVWEAPPGG